MKIIIAAGGTGGHIYPGIAIANYIKEKEPEAEILFIGTDKGLEKELVPKEGYKMDIIRVKGFKRRLSLDTFKTVKELFFGLKDAKRIIKTFKPDVVIGTGGYVCGPVLFTAWQCKVPTLIHEQNAFPGVTNRILSHFVDKVAASFPEAVPYFKKKERVVISGNPIRSEFKERNRENARLKLSIPLDKRVIVVTGGSQGALSINTSMIDVISEFKTRKDIYIVHITGKKQYEKVIHMLREKNIDLSSLDHIKVVPYSFDMANLFKSSDLIIARAGAMTVSEIAAVGRSSILIPYPYATGNHQEFNARVITDKSGGVIILDKELNGKLLTDTITRIISNERKIKEMEEITVKLGILNADNIIYDEVKKLAFK